MNTARRIVLIFTIAFALNALWEFWHAQFYIHYQSGAITAFILLRAALVDAAIITIAVFVWVHRKSPVKSHGAGFSNSRELENLWDAKILWFAIPAWLIVAILLEKWALATNRWAYNETMPLIPFIETGLTPTIQLALLGTISWYIAQRFILCKRGKTR